MTLRILACLTLLGLVAGCSSITGTWELAPGQEPQALTVAKMTLMKDGSFTATAVYGPRNEEMSGTYTYAGGKLEFDTDGTKRTYGAMKSGDELTLTHDGTTVKMVRADED